MPPGIAYGRSVATPIMPPSSSWSLVPPAAL